VGVSISGSISVVYVYVDRQQASDDIFETQTRASRLGLSSAQSPSLLQQPRIVYLEMEDSDAPIRVGQRTLEDDPMLHASPGEEAVVQDHMRVVHDDPDCLPVAEWQSRSFPNCNAVHELDLNSAIDEAKSTGTSIDLLGTGWFRSTWQWNVGGDKSIALKTLRVDREFYDEYYDLHRRDAVAMERLTSSPFVMDIYGYCGQTALNELADFQWDTLEKFDKFLRGKKSKELNFLKLQLASSVAVGISHVHEVDERPSMVHYDVNPRNIAVVAGGRPKMNDFNTAEFLRYNPKTNQTCGFRSRLHEPWWRAPEEVTIGNPNLLDEKVDIYALGNLLFHILTTRSPRGKMKKERMEEVRVSVAQGLQPPMDAEFENSKDPALVAIKSAIGMCYEPDPKLRPSSRHVASVLMHALAKLKPTMKQIRV
jgi:serine/threonine protein kinase